MTKFTSRAAALVAALASSVAFANEGAATDSSKGLIAIAAALAIAIAAFGGTSGQGKAASSAYEGIGRNPQSADKLFTPLLLGLALIEFQTILAFVIAIMLTGKV